jgi:hypothetical protein
LKSAPAWIFLTIVMTVQVFTSGLSTTLIDLKKNLKESLLQDKDLSSPKDQ